MNENAEGSPKTIRKKTTDYMLKVPDFTLKGNAG